MDLGNAYPSMDVNWRLQHCFSDLYTAVLAEYVRENSNNNNAIRCMHAFGAHKQVVAENCTDSDDTFSTQKQVVLVLALSMVKCHKLKEAAALCTDMLTQEHHQATYADCHYVLAVASLAQHDLASAESHILTAVDIASKLNASPHESQARCRLVLGQLRVAQSRYAEAVQALIDAVNQFAAVNDAESLVDAYTALARCYRAQLDYSQAFSILKKLIASTRDSLSIGRAHKAMGDMYLEMAYNAKTVHDLDNSLEDYAGEAGTTIIPFLRVFSKEQGIVEADDWQERKMRAKEEFTEAYMTLQRTLGSDHDETREAQGALVEANNM